MTEEDKFALKEFARGVSFVIGFSAVIILVLAVLIGNEGETPLKPSAEVVDTYKGCDVVRWTNHQLADYKYFLHCEGEVR